MAITTLTTVLKTAQATSVKLAAPAFTGRGLATVVAYPADALSRQFPLPNPDSEPNPGDRQDPAARMREHPRAAVAVEPPAGPTGVHVPGTPARTRTGPSFRHQPFTSWRRLTTPTRAIPPVASSPSSCLGRDCQSPGRRTDVMAAKRGNRPTAAAGK